MKKRLLSAILLSATMFNLVSCGSGDKATSAEGGDGTTISVQVEEAWLPYYEKVRENVLAENEGANIEFKTVGSFDHLDVIEKTDVSNEDVADVFALPADKVTGLNKTASLAAIDAEAMAERVGGFKDFTNGLAASFNVDGEYLAFPYNIETLIGFINIENAKSAGIDTTKAMEFTDLTHEQMLVLLHDAWFGVAFTNSAEFNLLSESTDGKFTSDAVKEYSELNEDQKKLFESLFNYWKAHTENKTDLWDKDAAGGYLDNSFASGNGNVIRIDGPWATANLTERVGSEENLEVVPLNRITINGKELKHWKSGWGLGINARVEEDAEKMELATDFIEELVNPENAVDLFNATGKILENVEPSAYDSVDPMSKKVIDATYSSFEVALERPTFTEWNEVAQSWQNSLLSWSSTKPQTAEEAYNQVKAAFDAMMASMK